MSELHNINLYVQLLSVKTVTVVFDLIIYFIYVIVPMIPAIIIYKIFPDTTVGVKGILSGLKINATGAFGAYIIVVLLGHFIIRQALRDNERTYSQKYTMNVAFVDENGNALPNMQNVSLNEDLKIIARPPIVGQHASTIEFHAPSNTEAFYIEMPGFNMTPLEIVPDSLDEKGGNIYLGTVKLYKNSNTNISSTFTGYNPENVPGGSSSAGLPTPYGGPPTK